MSQLVELQRIFPLLEDESVALVAISYDTSAVLSSFANREGITFPLLSDVGSAVIDRLGLRNTHVQEQHAVYGFRPDPKYEGVPYPGVFVLDEAGVVTDKRFYQSYRERETGFGLVEQALGIVAAGGPTTTLKHGAVRASVGLDSPEYVTHQRLWLYVDLEIAPGYHVIGRGVPPGFRALAVELDLPGEIAVGPTTWPAARPFAVPDSLVDLPVYEGAIRGAIPLSIYLPPGAGDLTIGGKIQLQTCSETTCELPGSIDFTLKLAEGRFVRRPRK